VCVCLYNNIYITGCAFTNVKTYCTDGLQGESGRGFN